MNKKAVFALPYKDNSPSQPVSVLRQVMPLLFCSFFPAVPPPLVLLSPRSAERAAGASHAGSTLLEGNGSFTGAK